MKSGLNQRSPALTTFAQEQKILITWISTDRGCVQGVPDQSISKTSQKRHARTTKNHFNCRQGVIIIVVAQHLGDLMAPLGLGWKARTHAELALMDELTPLLRKRVQGRDISGLSAYEQ